MMISEAQKALTACFSKASPAAHSIFRTLYSVHVLVFVCVLTLGFVSDQFTDLSSL